MTAQVHDRVVWRYRDHLLVGVNGAPLFDPSEYGLRTAPTTTANWRGWVARYGIQDDRFTLMELTDVGLFLEPGESPPPIGDVAAQNESAHVYRYPDLHLHVSFTGRLIIARGFIQSLYRHMGFHPAWKFEESWEIDLDQGLVTQVREITEEMRMMREKIETGEKEDPDSPTRAGWIERTFRLDFRRSKGD